MSNIIFNSVCPSMILTKTCDSSDYTECAGILFMNLNRTYEGNKSGTIFVAEKLELKG